MKGNIALIGLVLSLGLGYDIEDVNGPENRAFKGIFKIEGSKDDYSYGLFHASVFNNGFEKSKEDQSIIYIMRDFKL